MRQANFFLIVSSFFSSFFLSSFFFLSFLVCGSGARFGIYF